MALRDFIPAMLRETKGNVLIVSALAMAGVAGAAGAAIDYERFHKARTAVQAAADSGVLAGTRTLAGNSGNGTGALRAAEAMFQKNIAGVDDLSDVSVAFQVNAAGTGITAAGSTGVKTSFMSLLGVSAMGFDVHAAAEAGAALPTSNLEISLMLDVTGSMCDDGEGPCTNSTKISGLKTAAKRLIDTVVWQDQSKFTSRAAIVPFSTRVRVGPDGQPSTLMRALTNLPQTWDGWYKLCLNSTGSGASETSGNWQCLEYQTQHQTTWKLMPCVTDRFYNASNTFDFTDTPPGPGAWFNGHDGTRMPASADSSNTAATADIGLSSSDPATFWNYEPNGMCYDLSNSDELMPLSSDRTALKAKIDGLEAYGATAGILGTAFSWYTLSPNWSGVWTTSAPAGSYAELAQVNSTGAPVLRKIAILMTDGVYNTWRDWKDQDPQEAAGYAIQMCDAMKAKGIEIYTVGFDLGSLSQADKATATAMLKACGSDIHHFYDSLTVQQLNTAFESIANQVANAGVRLVQ